MLESLTKQTGSCVALDDCYTACFFFNKDFYLRYRPRFRSVEFERSQYADFLKKHHLFDHSATFYLYICHVNHLGWHVLKNSSEASPRSFCDIYGGVIFHLRAAVVLSFLDFHNATKGKNAVIKLRRLAIGGINLLGWHFSTFSMRQWIRKIFSTYCPSFERWIEGQRFKSAKEEMESFKEKFIKNPDAYLFKLQNAKVVNNAIERQRCDH